MATEHHRNDDERTREHVRTGDPLMAEILRVVNNVSERQTTMHDELRDHIGREDHWMDEHTRRMAAVESAFPARDTRGHHDYHVELMTRADRWKQRYEKVKDSITEKAIFVLVGIFILGFWEYLKQGLK